MWCTLCGDNFHLFFSPTILLLLQRLFFRVNTACSGGWDGVKLGGGERFKDKLNPSNPKGFYYYQELLEHFNSN